MSNQNIGSLGQSSIAEVDSSPNLRESTPSNVSIDEANPLFEVNLIISMKDLIENNREFVKFS